MALTLLIYMFDSCSVWLDLYTRMLVSARSWRGVLICCNKWKQFTGSATLLMTMALCCICSLVCCQQARRDQITDLAQFPTAAQQRLIPREGHWPCRSADFNTHV